MPDDLQTLYWKERTKRLTVREGKIQAIVSSVSVASELRNNPIDVIELGCGAGDVIATIRSTCLSKDIPIGNVVGVDKDPFALKLALAEHGVGIKFKNIDYSTEKIHDLGKFDIVVMVNTLHEVFSSCRISGSIDFEEGKNLVTNVLKNVARLVKSDGYLIIFDGVEHEDPENKVEFNVLSQDAWISFEKFTNQYRGWKVKYSKEGSLVTMTCRDFTRYITKTIFLKNETWEIEKYESYQYFTASEFHNVLNASGFYMVKAAFYSPSLEQWTKQVKIISEGISFPHEHILLICRSLNV